MRDLRAPRQHASHRPELASAAHAHWLGLARGHRVHTRPDVDVG